MTVEIVQFEKHSWYRNMQGYSFNVSTLIEDPAYYVIIEGDETGLFIRKMDCIIKESD